MAEDLQDPSQELAAEPPPVTQVASEPATESQDMPPPAAKRKGRPPGAKDTIKRVRRPPVQIRVEPITLRQQAALDVPEPVVERVATPRPKTEPKLETKQPVEIEEDPPTPRTMLRGNTSLCINERPCT